MTATHLRVAETTAERDEWRRLAARLAEALRGHGCGHCPGCEAPHAPNNEDGDSIRDLLKEHEAASGKTGGGSET